MVPWGFPDSSDGKESVCNAGDPSLIPELGRSPGKGKGYPLQYSGLENSMVCRVHGVQSQTRLSDFHLHWGDFTHRHLYGGLILHHKGLAAWLVLTNEMLVDVRHTRAGNVPMNLALLSCTKDHAHCSQCPFSLGTEGDMRGRLHARDGPGKLDLESDWSLKSCRAAADPQTHEFENALF